MKNLKNKILYKWQKFSIKYRLFLITSGLLVTMSILIYLILTSLLPSFYQLYKIDIFEDTVDLIVDIAKDNELEEVKELLFYVKKRHNLSIILRSSDGKIVYGENQFILKNAKYILQHAEHDEYSIQMPLEIKGSNMPYIIDITMPLQPVDEATDVIKEIMPTILILCILIGIIGAYIYLNVITKPLIDIIEREREIENKRKDFIATISHELKTPITIISGQVEGMIYNIGKYKDRDTYLKKSYESVQELRQLVDEMVEVSRSEIIASDLNKRKINLGDLLKRLVNRQIFLIEEKNTSLKLDIMDDIYIECDIERIEKAINNIINNAIKYSPENENLIVNLYRKNSKGNKKLSGDKIYLEIINTGINIDEKDLSQIFNPFYRVEKSRSRKTGGSGLGLYLTSQILISHGYTYSIKNIDNSVLFLIEI
ncbi:MAG: HAMP domain-containing sensor histidine kinase [Peptostreptococcaceae bacterium]